MAGRVAVDLGDQARDGTVRVRRYRRPALSVGDQVEVVDGAEGVLADAMVDRFSLSGRFLYLRVDWDSAHDLEERD
jgi:hypothetical protein